MDFFVNQAMGMGNSGIEHSEFYRAKRFEEAGIPYRFIFLAEVPELHKAMSKWRLKNENVINMWEYFVLGDDYLKHGLTETFPAKKVRVLSDATNTMRMNEFYTDSGLHIVHHFVKEKNKQKPESKILMVRAYQTQIFSTKTGELKASYETINNEHEEGRLQNIHLYNAHGEHLYFANIVRLYRYFFEQLDRFFGGKSNFYIDRGDWADEALMHEPMPDAKIIYLIHADHLADRNDPAKPFWNNYYEYLLDHIKHVDRIVVSTEQQRQDLLIDFPDEADKIWAIPVGGISDKPKKIKDRKPDGLKLITASRLAKEKHVDIAEKAVIELHNEGKNVSFDIYGVGEEKKHLEEIVKENHAESYVHVRGLSQHLELVYPRHDAFVSTSFSEGFGLTYIEALNAALPVVTFNARFGATQLIRDGENGFIEDFKRDDEKYDVAQIKKGITRLLNADYLKLRRNTQVGIDKYRNSAIAKEWEKLVNGLRTN
ncbi:glycosyltransferase [Lactobacillus sp. ESL0679]|uniref:glycosyltransferase n=1 Tax=Lactobacillus sp. ESL0679 TaxID=2983209 RepID=UPI0023FA06F7|nr:glycosyltransferase [Lactobacillus sp. ESL0679]MDF7683417.1 glycosyltransferase [Lactobacillus sp. ESL0679]